MANRKRARRKKETSDARAKRNVKPDAKPRRRVFEAMRLATVAFGLEQPDGFNVIGTGFAVESNGIIVTAKHVLTGLNDLTNREIAAGNKPKPRVIVFGPAQYIQTSPTTFRINMPLLSAVIEKTEVHLKRDIACVRIRLPKNAVVHTVKVDYAAESFEGDDVATCGFPYGLANVHEGKSVISSFLTGIVSAVVPHPVVPAAQRLQYLLELPVNPGNSGGAVFDPDTGCVMAVVCRRFAPQNIPTGLSIAEPIHLARKLIEECKKP